MQNIDNPESFVEPWIEKEFCSLYKKNSIKVLQVAWRSFETEKFQNCSKHAGFLSREIKKTDSDTAVDCSPWMNREDIFL